jgi:hypothetical protein
VKEYAYICPRREGKVAKRSAAEFAAVSPAAPPSDHIQQIKDEEDDENRAEAAAGTVPPLAAMRPCGDGADEKEDEDDQEDGEHTSDSELLWEADARRGGNSVRPKTVTIKLYNIN